MIDQVASGAQMLVESGGREAPAPSDDVARFASMVDAALSSMPQRQRGGDRPGLVSQPQPLQLGSEVVAEGAGEAVARMLLVGKLEASSSEGEEGEMGAGEAGEMAGDEQKIEPLKLSEPRADDKAKPAAAGPTHVELKTGWEEAATPLGSGFISLEVMRHEIVFAEGEGGGEAVEGLDALKEMSQQAVEDFRRKAGLSTSAEPAAAVVTPEPAAVAAPEAPSAMPVRYGPFSGQERDHDTYADMDPAPHAPAEMAAHVKHVRRLGEIGSMVEAAGPVAKPLELPDLGRPEAGRDEAKSFGQVLAAVRGGHDGDAKGLTNLGRPQIDMATHAALQANVEGRTDHVPTAVGEMLFNADMKAVGGDVDVKAPDLPEAVRDTKPENFVRDVGDLIGSYYKAGKRWVEVQLKPVELGVIEVRMQLDHKGAFTAVIAADNQSTLDLLRRESDGLQRALAEAGIKADAGSLKFEHRQTGGEGWTSREDERRDDGPAPEGREEAEDAAPRPGPKRGLLI